MGERETLLPAAHGAVEIDPYDRTVLVTQRMIDAGYDEIADYDERFDSLSDYMEGIFRRMMKVMQEDLAAAGRTIELDR